MKRILLPLFLALVATPAFGQSNLNVTATIAASCAISTTDHLTFTYDPAVANRVAGSDATDAATFEVICTDPGTHSVEFGFGLHATGDQRAMAGGGEELTYDLYDGATKLLPNQTMNVTTTTAGQAVTVTIDGKVVGGQMVPSGTYNDTVVATVNL